MNVVCAAACTAGTAHTYIAREKLIKGTKTLSHTIKIEAQGTTSTENELQAADISATDVMILVIDVKTKGEGCFANKRIVRARTEIVIESPVQLLEKIEKSLGNR